jgi:hypothetical protein
VIADDSRGTVGLRPKACAESVLDHFLDRQGAGRIISEIVAIR